MQKDKSCLKIKAENTYLFSSSDSMNITKGQLRQDSSPVCSISRYLPICPHILHFWVSNLSLGSTHQNIQDVFLVIYCLLYISEREEDEQYSFPSKGHAFRWKHF